jgi:predicted  nucleic acid-binding Zn-ribbon protein
MIFINPIKTGDGFVEHLRLLWELQEIEREIGQKEKELQNLASVLKYKQQKKAYLNFLEDKKITEEKHAGDKKNLKLYEMKLQNISDTLKELNSELYGGKIGSAKELESLEKKVRSKEKEKSDLEEKILAFMENLENDEEIIAELKNREKEKKEALQKSNTHARRDVENARSGLELLKEKKDELMHAIEPKLISKYRELNNRLQGRCISLVKKGFCGVCNVSLPSSFRSRMLTPGELVFCENCGCLLVPGD